MRRVLTALMLTGLLTVGLACDEKKSTPSGDGAAPAPGPGGQPPAPPPGPSGSGVNAGGPPVKSKGLQ
jgi:hypothetical protein